MISADEQDLLPNEFTYELEKADKDYARYLQRRGITAEQHEQEIGEWLDAQD